MSTEPYEAVKTRVEAAMAEGVTRVDIRDEAVRKLREQLESACRRAAATSPSHWVALSTPQFDEPSMRWCHRFMVDDGPIGPDMAGWTVFGPWPDGDKVARATKEPSHGATREQG